MVKILFVCLGNICRSPSAEGIMKSLVETKGLQNSFFIDSAGTSGFHIGEPADKRMRMHARKRGYDLLSISRQLVAKDFSTFTMIIGMDEENMTDILRMSKRVHCTAEIRRMVDFCTTFTDRDVPDPYYGGEQGFEHVLDLLEDACEGLIGYTQQQYGSKL